MQDIKVKICGLSSVNTVIGTCRAGASFIGFVHYKTSPRHVSLEEVEKLTKIAKQCNGDVKTVLVCANPNSKTIENISSLENLDIVQLHGNESTEDVENIRKITKGKAIIKAARVATTKDIENAVLEYGDCADYLLFDTKMADPRLPIGGTGRSFNWQILDSVIPRVNISKSWFLSGGINAKNLARALDKLEQLTEQPLIDVSSGVESSSGIKDIGKIEDLLNVVKRRNKLRIS